MDPDALQWTVLGTLVAAHPETVTIEELCRRQPDENVEEAVARLLIDGLAIRFGRWLKATEPAARFEQLASAQGVSLPYSSRTRFERPDSLRPLGAPSSH